MIVARQCLIHRVDVPRVAVDFNEEDYFQFEDSEFNIARENFPLLPNIHQQHKCDF